MTSKTDNLSDFNEAGFEKEKDASAPKKEKELEKINSILESVGISPIDEKEPKKQSEVEKAKTRRIDSGKTKHFNLKSGAEKSPGKAPSGRQLTFDGYEDESGPKIVSDSEVETRLKKTRQNLIENFRVLSNVDGDKAILEKEPTGKGGASLADLLEPKKGENLFDAVERAGDRKKVKNILERTMRSVQQKARLEKLKEELKSAKKERKTLKQQTVFQKKQLKIFLLLFAFSLVLFFMLCANSASGAFSFLFGANGAVFILLNLLLLALGAVFSRGVLKEGISDVLKFAPGAEFFVLLSGVISLLQCLSLFVFKPQDVSGYTVFTPFFFFSLLAFYASEYLRIEGVRRDISVLMRSKELSTLRTVENKNDADSLGYGISKGEPQILYTADCDLPTDFERFSLSRKADEKLLFVVGILTLGLSAAFAVFGAVTQKSAWAFFFAFSGSFCLCVPVLFNLVSALIKLGNDKALAASSAVVACASSAESVAKANGIVASADEIFEGRVSKFRTVPGVRIAQTDAVVFAASALKKTRSVIRNAFDPFLAEEGIRPPEAEDVQYEEKLGYACWVVGRRVLVGNREMLLAHSISAPSEEEEKAFAKGKNVMYVVLEGAIIALFVVDYRVRSEVKKSVRSFNKTGLVLILDCGDPSLTQELVSKKLMADIAAIKLASTKDSTLVSSLRKNSAFKKENGLACAKKDRNILLLINAAHNLFEADRLSKIVMLAGLGFSFALGIVCAVLKVSLAFNPVILIVFQLIWGAIAYIAGKTRIN